MPDRDLELDARLALALGWGLIPSTDEGQALWFYGTPGQPGSLSPAKLDLKRLRPATVPALSTDPSQVVERMSARGWQLVLTTEPQFLGGTVAAFDRNRIRSREFDASFSVAIAKAALSALEAERESQNQQETT
jgi:hypothetical protein